VVVRWQAGPPWRVSQHHSQVGGRAAVEFVPLAALCATRECWSGDYSTSRVIGVLILLPLHSRGIQPCTVASTDSRQLSPGRRAVRAVRSGLLPLMWRRSTWMCPGTNEVLGYAGINSYREAWRCTFF